MNKMTPALERTIEKANRLSAQIKALQEEQEKLLKKVTAAAYAEDATVEFVDTLFRKVHDHVTRCFLKDAELQAAIRQSEEKS